MQYPRLAQGDHEDGADRHQTSRDRSRPSQVSVRSDLSVPPLSVLPVTFALLRGSSATRLLVLFVRDGSNPYVPSRMGRERAVELQERRMYGLPRHPVSCLRLSQAHRSKPLPKLDLFKVGMGFSADLSIIRGADLPSGLHDQSIYFVVIKLRIRAVNSRAMFRHCSR